MVFPSKYEIWLAPVNLRKCIRNYWLTLSEKEEKNTAQ